MGPGDDGVRIGAGELRPGQGHAVLLQAGEHLPVAVVPDPAELLQHPAEDRVGGGHEQAQNMDLRAVVNAGNLDAGNQPDSGGVRGVLSGGDAVHRVVVGQGDGIKSRLHRQ